MTDWVRNALGRQVPRSIPGLGELLPYQGPMARIGGETSVPRICPPLKPEPPTRNKVTHNLKKAIEDSGLENGMTISFHHHLRNGDAVLPMVLEALREMGFANLTLAPSSLTGAHDCVADYVRSGTVDRIFTSGLRGEVGRMVSRGEMEIPVVVRSHGGRARAVEEGSIAVDVAFIAAPACDALGNMTGSEGRSACGSMGYPMVDARYAGHVIALTDNLTDYPLAPRISIPQHQVNQVVEIDSLGDPAKIATGAARITRNPVDLRIAGSCYDLIQASGMLAPGVSFQVGAGGISLATASYVRTAMRERGIRGSFGLGGITGYMAGMLEEGLFKALYDVQSFDASVRDSLAHNPSHMEIDASWYANPLNRGCVAHNLDIVVLAALDIDTDFNVNVLTGNDGFLRGASGGHSDTAAGSSLCIVAAPSFRGGVPTIKEHVNTVVTPGETVDAVVTERGICINPRREDLLQAATRAGLPVVDIERLHADVVALTGRPEPVAFDEDRVVALVEYRDGTIIDCAYKVEE
ncbi:MAG: citrate lyase subunit alpha [Synergistales bacterium]|nr:citrate lyase subunit alpha [Synergistales bacterium]